MSITDKYFDLVIEKNSFYISESSQISSEKDFAVKTLKKILFVVKNNLNYTSSQHDNFSKLSKKNLFEALEQRASDIARRFRHIQRKKNYGIKHFLEPEAEQKVNELQLRIVNTISPSPVFPLPPELIQKILSYLEIEDLVAFSELNHKSRDHSLASLPRRARPFGYEGNSHIEALRHLKKVAKKIKVVCHQGLFPEKYFSYMKQDFLDKLLEVKFINIKATLENLKNLTEEDFLDFIANEEVYSEEFRPLIQALCAQMELRRLSTKCSIKQKNALLLASMNGEKTILSFLLRAGVNPNFLNEKGSGPLHYAAQAGLEEIVEMLIQYNANVNEHSSQNHATPLVFACGYGYHQFFRPNRQVVEHLLINGADPNIPSNTGIYPLHYAAEAGLEEMVELLLQTNVDVNKRAGCGFNTPLAFACGCGDPQTFQPNPEVVKLLLEHGADPNILDSTGKSPLHYAVLANQAEIIKLLLQYLRKYQRAREGV
ncbi:hypothetical protein PHSC3_000286 [Chlamydiales bacterium STE3]|nr:hypothetical protein PHSC3_000286 [Chlamydiales bacterium STE3]